MVLLAASPPAAPAQSSGVLHVAPLSKQVVKRQEINTVSLRAVLKDGYHVNSHTPSEDYLIPLRLTWEKGLIQPVEIIFPKPRLEKYAFSEKPLSVFTGDFDITTRFRLTAKAIPGPQIVIGQLRYQACNHNSCLPPKTIEVRLPLDIR